MHNFLPNQYTLVPIYTNTSLLWGSNEVGLGVEAVTCILAGKFLVFLFFSTPQLLLWSSKPEVEKMSVQLQHLVTTEPYLSPESTSTGCVCAARYSMDGQWYRAIVRQPFQSQSQQVYI